MTLVRLDPPGTHCTFAALRDAVRARGGKTFLDVGCGAGSYSKVLCEEGLTGVAVDFSARALSVAKHTLEQEVESGRCALREGDVLTLPDDFARVDLAVSIMVMEHVADDVNFLRSMARFVAPGGNVIVAVPGRRDCWTFEDETVGHLRRYDKPDLERVLRAAGFVDVEVWSVAVPVANMLLWVGDFMVRRSAEADKLGQSQREQTETSGIRDIPWKTVFPSWVQLILNRYTLWPLFFAQRLFYRTGVGVTMFGLGRVR